MRCSLNLLKNLIFRHVLALNDISTVIIDVYNYLREDRKLKARKSNRMAPAAMKTYMKNTSVSNPSSNSTICNSNVLNVSLSLLGNNIIFLEILVIFLLFQYPYLYCFIENRIEIEIAFRVSVVKVNC